jgi:cobalamin biosynthesis protein CobD/CbiB
MSDGPSSPPTVSRLIGPLLRRLAYGFLLAICGVPAGMALIADGDLRQGVIIGAVLFGLTVLIGVAVTVAREYRAARESGDLEAARRERADRQPPGQ